MSKLVEPWWDEIRNPITGLKCGSHNRITDRRKNIEELKYYDAYPTLDTKTL